MEFAILPYEESSLVSRTRLKNHFCNLHDLLCGSNAHWRRIIQRCIQAVKTVLALKQSAISKAASVLPFRKTAAKKAEASQRAERYLNEYGNSILRLAYSYVHSMDDAEDILQETLIRVLEANPSFENSAHEKAYLLRTASNLAKNHLSYSKLHETDELNDELAAEEREDLSFVWDAVKRLPEPSREVLHLFYYEGYATADIARILQRKESTIRSDLKRARERLKLLLKEDYDFE